jgi:hypothetical protein
MGCMESNMKRYEEPSSTDFVLLRIQLFPSVLNGDFTSSCCVPLILSAEYAA